MHSTDLIQLLSCALQIVHRNVFPLETGVDRDGLFKWNEKIHLHTWHERVGEWVCGRSR